MRVGSLALTSDPKMSRRSSRRPRYDILLIEPDSADAERFRDVFGAGDETRTAVHVVRDADEALEYVDRRGAYADASPPDLVLLDSQLPGMGGLELLSELKSHSDVGHVPVVVLGNASDTDEVVETYRRRANARVSKPNDPAALERVVRSLERFWLRTVQLPTVEP